jgi:uncharacterized membrane protein YdjX (TVP38/TMEM64 family)
MKKVSQVLKKIFTLKNVLITLAVIGVLVLIGVTWGPELWAFFGDTERVRGLIRDSGPLGPLIYIVLQIFQTVLAPIPGNVVGAVGGAAFGWWGLLLTIIGSAIGMAIAIAIARRFGRPLLEKFFKKSEVNKFDWLLNHPAAEMVLFLIFLFPFMPDDIVGFLAGLTKIRFRNLMLISIVGKAPMQLVTNLLGTKLFDGNIWTVLIILAAIALLALLIYVKRRWLTGLLQADDHLKYLKDSIIRKKVVKSKHVPKHNQK